MEFLCHTLKVFIFTRKIQPKMVLPVQIQENLNQKLANTEFNLISLHAEIMDHNEMVVGSSIL